MLYGGVTLPGRPDPDNIAVLDRLPVPQIRRMQRVGVAIDREWLGRLTEELESRRAQLRAEISGYIPEESLEIFVSQAGELGELNPESSAQIAILLYQVLRVGKNRYLKRTKSGKRLSAGKKQLETLKREHPVIQKILAYREASKLVSTYTERLPAMAREAGDGSRRVHTQILTTRTDTGRLASKNPNLQNIPTRTKDGQEVRRGFIAGTGKKLVSVDYSQIELRLLAHYSQDSSMLRIFREGGDIHLDTAMRAFELPAEKVDRLLHRAPCKNVNFGVVYGLGEQGLYDLMAVTYATAGLGLPDWLTVEWCAGFIEKWFELYPQVREYMELQHWRARKYGMVWDGFGRVRRVPEVQSCHERIRAAGLRQAGNMPIQSAAAGVMKIGMARVEERLEEWRAEGVDVEALLPVHDELLIEVEERWVEEVKEMVEREMEKAMKDTGTTEELCRAPVKTEGKISDRWEK